MPDFERTPHAPSQQWVIDKRIPLALIFALALQTGGALVWAGTVSQRLETIEKQQIEQRSFGDRITRVEVTIDTVKETTRDTKETMTRVEQKIDGLQQQQRNHGQR